MLFPPTGIAIFIYFEFRSKLLVFLFQLRNSLQCTFNDVIVICLRATFVFDTIIINLLSCVNICFWHIFKKIIYNESVTKQTKKILFIYRLRNTRR